MTRRLRKRSPAFVPSNRDQDTEENTEETTEETEHTETVCPDALPLFIPIVTVSADEEQGLKPDEEFREEDTPTEEPSVPELSNTEEFIEEAIPDKAPLKVPELTDAVPPPQETSSAAPVQDRSVPRGKPPKPRKKQKLNLRSRTKKERKRFTGLLKENRSESVKLTPTYKVLPKREEAQEAPAFKTKNPRARARIKKVMERWESE